MCETKTSDFLAEGEKHLPLFSRITKPINNLTVIICYILAIETRVKRIDIIIRDNKSHLVLFSQHMCRLPHTEKCKRYLPKMERINHKLHEMNNQNSALIPCVQAHLTAKASHFLSVFRPRGGPWTDE
jgi:hypothetical protein